MINKAINRYQVERAWENRDMKVTTLKGHTATISALQIATNSDKFVSGSVDTKICLWDSKEKKVIRSFRGHASTVRCVHAEIPDKYLISGSEDKTVKVMNGILLLLTLLRFGI